MTEFRESLQRQAEEMRTEIAGLEGQKEVIDRRLQERKLYVEKLNPLLQAEGLDTISVVTGPPKRGFASPGNRSAETPKRRPNYEDLTLTRSVELVLGPGAAMHADEIVNHVYLIETKEDFKRAKQSLVGTLSYLDRHDGSVARVPGRPNTFQLRAVLYPNGQSPAPAGAVS